MSELYLAHFEATSPRWTGEIIVGVYEDKARAKQAIEECLGRPVPWTSEDEDSATCYEPVEFQLPDRWTERTTIIRVRLYKLNETFHQRSERHRVEYIGSSYGLNREQAIRADQLMNGPMNQHPQPLVDLINEAGRRFGHSQDILWECVVAYLKGQTLEEYLAK